MAGGGRGDGVSLAEEGERVDGEGGRPGHGERRGGRELEVQRQGGIGGGFVEPPDPPHDHRA
jgi:hypothetical protein